MKTKTLLKKICIVFLLLAFINQQAIASTQQTVGAGALVTGSMGVYMGVATGTVIAATGGLAIAAIGAAILVTNALTVPTDNSQAPIQIDLNPNVPLKTPTGWTAPVAPATQPTPPSTVSATEYFTDGYNNVTSTQQAACDGVAAHRQATNYLGVNATFTTSSYNALQPYVNGSSYFTCQIMATWGSNTQTDPATISANQSCPTGTTSNGINCTVNNPSAIPKPETNQDHIQRVGNTFLRDPKQNPADTNPQSAVNVTSNTVTVNGADGSKTVVTINSDGTSNVTVTTPNTNDGNSTKSSTDFSAPDAGGNVSVMGKSSQQMAGQGSAATGSQVGQLDISSLNKEGTQQQIKADLDAIKTGLCGGTGQPKCQIDEGNTNTGTPDGVNHLNNALDGVAGSIEGWVNSKQAPTDDHTSANPLSNIPAGSCSPLVTGGWGVVPTITLDPCPIADAVIPMIDWLFKALGAIYVVIRFREVTSGAKA